MLGIEIKSKLNNTKMKKVIGIILEIIFYLTSFGLFIYGGIIGYTLLDAMEKISNRSNMFDGLFQAMGFNIVFLILIFALICLGLGFILTQLREVFNQNERIMF